MQSLSRWLLIALAAVSLMFLSLAAGCGGDDDTEEAGEATPADDVGSGGDDDDGGDGGDAEDLGAYFASIEAIFEEADAQSDELETAFDEAYADAQTVEDAKQALGAFLLDTSDIYTDALAALKDIDAPRAVSEQHNEFIAAGEDLLDLSRELFEALQDEETK